MVFKAEKSFPIPNKDLLSWTFDDNKADPNEPRYIDAKDPSRSFSLNQAKSIIRKLVAGFHAAGLKKGDCVCLSSFNDINYSIMFLGIVAAGGVFSGTNPSYTEHELVHHIKTAKCKFLVAEPELLDNVLAAAKSTGIPLSRVWILDSLGQKIPSGFKSYKGLLTHGEEDWVRFDDRKTADETTAALLFSSGTTGLPKAVVLSHRNLVGQHTMVYEATKRPWEIRQILCLPMFHAACVPVAHTSVLRGGHTVFVMRRFDLEPCLSYIEKYKLTEAGFVPPIFVAIVMSGLGKKYSLKSLKMVTSGAAPLGRDTQARMQEYLSKDARVLQVWGMTETSCIASQFEYPEGDDTGSVGRMLPDLDVKLVDDQDKEVTDYDTRGEMCVRGPTVTKGYFENDRANAESFDSEGFFKTGDIMYCDSKTRKWYVVDRKKELIKVRGFQVAPPELEAVLLGHPHIVDAAVIGVKDAKVKDIEHPRAYVVKRPGAESQKLDEKAVKDFCGPKLAKYKALTGGVVFLDAIPKNASGKILKRILREMADKELAEGKAKL